MLAEKELKRVYNLLLKETPVEVRIDDMDITIRTLEGASKLSLSSVVYFGGNYIPKSVRGGLSEKPPFTQDHIQTIFSVDEEHFTIYLHYVGGLEALYSARLAFLLEDFGSLADQWRMFFDERDRNDLVYIYNKS